MNACMFTEGTNEEKQLDAGDVLRVSCIFFHVDTKCKEEEDLAELIGQKGGDPFFRAKKVVQEVKSCHERK